MPDNRQVLSNGGVFNSSKSSVDKLEEATRRLKIHTNDSQDSGAVANCCPYPDRPGEPDCTHYLRTGLCGYGSKCRFNHPVSAGKVTRFLYKDGGQYRGELPERVGQPDCGYYLKTGACKYGSTCKFHHPRDKHGVGPIPLNILGLPMRQEADPCPFYMRTGLCKFGVACKFHHPQPAATETVLPVPGPAAYGTSSSSIVPLSSLHFVGGVSALSLPRAPYISGPGVQGPQTYMPVIVSPSQAHGWNTYLGESGSSGPVHLLSTPIPPLPERPNQPECRYFMSTGSCKYGSDCKFHHPRERITQLTTNSLGPLGLPLRPGQAVCSYYTSYGLCKYGPTCKFDHPLPGYSYNNGLSFPTLPVFDQSFFPSQRNFPRVLSSETPPFKTSKVTDWVSKPEAASNKNQNLDTETTGNSPEQASSSPHPIPVSSELSDDHQSD